MLVSTRRSIQYPNTNRSDQPDVPLHISNLIAALDLDTPFYTGLLSARPATSAVVQGSWYFATDNLQVYFNTGSAWLMVSTLAPTQQIFQGTGGTYNTPAGCRMLIVEGVGGGGAGGGTPAISSAQNAVGGGGQGGMYAMKRIVTPASSYVYSCGPGGVGAVGLGGNAGSDTTFGAVLTAKGGAGGGQTGAVTAPLIVPAGGAIVSGGVGDLILPGEPGQPGIITVAALGSQGCLGGAGGPAARGGGGGNANYNTDHAGNNGNQGGGGSGACANSAGFAAQAGGNGGAGFIIVTEYY
jgi:hypothetical protein